MLRFFKIFFLTISLFLFIFLLSCNKKAVQTSKNNTFEINSDTSSLLSPFEKLYTKFDSEELNSALYKFIENDSILKSFYESDSCGLLFFSGYEKQYELEEVINILSNVDQHGLNPKMFNVDMIQKLTIDIDSGYIEKDSINEKLVILDNIVTQSAIKYIIGMNYGFLIPDSLFNEDDYAIKTLRPDSTFLSNIYSDIRKDVVSAMYQSLPSDSIYQYMLAEYDYWKSKKDDELPEIKLREANLQYTIGNRDKNINAIAKRLMWTGEFKPDSTYSDTLYQTMTKQLLAAVNNFRETNSYPDDDKEVGNLTLKALNRRADYYLQKIAANMERYRWKRYKKTNFKHIEVNVAAFKLFAVQEDSLPLVMRICVGQNKHKTPLLQSTIAYLNLNPIWNVPKSIAKNETFPMQKRDTSYLRKHNMRLYKGGREIDYRKIDWKRSRISENSYFVRQDPGPYNALGRIKFMFSNKFSVYLHDTPSQMAFKRKDRAVSHGCVRVQRPVDLAFFCLSPTTELYRDKLLYSIDRTPTTKESKQLLSQGKLDKLKDVITLANKEKVSLAIDYYTVYMHPGKNKLYYADDVYGYDNVINNTLNNLGKYYKKAEKTNKDELY